MLTILLIIKKATVIYLLISSLLFILFSHQSFATEELTSFCFEPQDSLEQAKKSIEFLLLPKEQVVLRQQEHCFEIIISPDRSKLLEKFLLKRYTLLTNKAGHISGPGNLNNQNCQIELKTSKKKKVDSTKVLVGNVNAVSTKTNEITEVSSSQFLLGFGKPGTLDLEGHSLYIECTGGVRDIFQLTFSYNEEVKAKISTQVTLKRGELLQIAQVTNDLNSKSKTLGIPDSLYNESVGSENISYELEIK